MKFLRVNSEMMPKYVNKTDDYKILILKNIKVVDLEKGK